MKIKSLIPFIFIFVCPLSAQTNTSYSRIDCYLANGENGKVIDTCRLILSVDSLNPVIHFKLGVAYQNILETDSSIMSIKRACNIDPQNRIYRYMLAKGYYTRGKNNMAEPLFNSLCSEDTLNWVYAYYLSTIYMQSGKFDNAAEIYRKFVNKDPDNCVYLDKLGYANLKRGNFDEAIALYSKSMAINPMNLTAIKNLAYLYANTNKSDTAIVLLSRGIEIDPADIDCYRSRAQIYFSKNYTKKALDDYLVILSSGDTSVLYLKRVGIGYYYNLQPRESIPYLLRALRLDPSDYDICNYLGRIYSSIMDTENSMRFYKKEIDLITPLYWQFGYTYYRLAETQKKAGLYNEAIYSYFRSQQVRNDPGISMIIANIYDEILNDRPNAIKYYQKYLDEVAKYKINLSPEYENMIKKRLTFLINNPSEGS